MNRRHVAALAVVLVVVGWAGYSVYVFNLEAFESNQQTVVMTSDAVSAGGTMAAHVAVTDRKSGDALTDASVDLFLVNRSDRRKVASGPVGADGSYTVTFDAPDDPGSYELHARANSTLGVDEVSTDFEATNEYSILVDTDKPVYQPGQTMTIRGVLTERDGDPVTSEATVTVEGPRGNQLFSRVLDLNEYGMGQLSFPVSSEGRTGRYRISIAHDGEERTRTVTVDRYQTPQFDVQFRPDRSYYRPGETLRATVASEYFFGEPVENATVRVEGAGYVGDFEQFATVDTTTDERGVATVDLELPTYFIGLPQQDDKGVVALNVSVTDQAGHTETITRTVPVARGDLVVDGFPASGELVPGVENTVYVTVARPDGRPAQATVDVGDETVETNEYGIATYTFVPEGEDERLDLRATTGDASVTDRVYFDVDPGNRVALQIERGTYAVGETVRGEVLVADGTGTVYVDVVGGKQTHLTRSLAVEDGRASFSFDVPPGMAGDLKVRAWSVSDDGRVAASARHVLVRPADDVNVTVTANQSVYRPGQPASLRVTTRQDGEPVPAAVGIDVVDESVFAVEEDRAGLARTQFGLDRELMEPRLFVHDYSLDRMREPATSDEERLVREASVARLPAEPGGATVNSFDEKRQQIDRRQSDHRETNGWLLAALLAGLPLGVAVAGVRTRTPRTFLVQLGIGAGLVLVGLLAGTITLVVVFALAVSTAGIAGLLALLGVLLALCYLASVAEWGGLSSFGRRLGTLFVAYVGLVALALALQQWVALTVPLGVWYVVAPAFLLFPVTVVGAGAPERRRAALVKALSVGLVASLVLAPLSMAFVGGFGMMASTGSAVSEDGGQPDAAADDQADAQGGDDVRQFFPETLASRTVVTGPDGEATVSLQMADSITTWRVSSLASTRDGALGSDRSTVRVFQPFFVRPDVPLALTQNDTVTVPVGVFNYENDTKQVRVTLERADWFTAENYTKNVTVGGESVERASFTITAERNGEFPLTIAAVGHSTDGNRSVDAVRKSVTVEPYGSRRTQTRSGVVDGTESAAFQVPERAVPNSSTTVLRVYPGAFGQVVQGMETLLARPTGCFEQTSSSLYPNVLVLQYMEQTGQANPELRMTAERFIATGYQRLLTFETSTPGGYSLFGDDPPNLLLTAYGLQEMSDMSAVYGVDPAVIAEMQTFLAERQQADGSWPSDGRLEYAIGVSGNDVSTTAYVSWSLAHSGYDGRAVDDGLDYVERSLDVESAGTGTLAVVLNALVDAEAKPQLRQRVAGELASRAERDDDGAVYWVRSETAGGYEYGSKNVLTTAMVANAFVTGQYHPGLTDGALQYLVSNKRGDGGWGSTQSTVMALKALVAAQQGTAEVETGTLRVSVNGERAATVEVTEATRDEVQTVVLPSSVGPTDVTIDGPADSGLYYEVTNEYYAPWETVEAERTGGSSPLGMTVEYDRTNLTVDDTVSVRTTIRNDGGRIGMALVDLGVPPGFTVEESSLDELVREGVISRYEVAGQQVVVYVEDLEGSLSFSFDVRATQPIEARSGASEVRDYYDPDTSATEAPVVFHVRGTGDDGSNGTDGS